MLLRKRKITLEFIRMLDGLRYSGFNVFVSRRIQPGEKKSLETLAAYLVPATFSQKRMEYSPDEATVLYRSNDGKDRKTYDALEWVAATACQARKETNRPSVPTAAAPSPQEAESANGNKSSLFPPCWSP